MGKRTERIVAFLFATSLISASCAQQMDNDPTQAELYIGTTNVGAVSVGSPLANLNVADELSRRIVSMEGDSYLIVTYKVAMHATIDCLVVDSVIDRIMVHSPEILDEKQLGVGSTLSALESTYPDGKFYIGQADTLFASFVRGDGVIYRFDDDTIPPDCFVAGGKKCELDHDTLKVSVVEVVRSRGLWE